MEDDAFEVLHEKIWEEHQKMVGRVVRIATADVGDGSDDIWYIRFPQPILVRILPMTEGPDINEHDDGGGLIDTTYDAEALPGQLEPELHVAFINGPTYYVDGRRVYYWEEVQNGAPG